MMNDISRGLPLLLHKKKGMMNDHPVCRRRRARSWCPNPAPVCGLGTGTKSCSRRPPRAADARMARAACGGCPGVPSLLVDHRARPSTRAHGRRFLRFPVPGRADARPMA